jgi:hypothetical protein
MATTSLVEKVKDREKDSSKVLLLLNVDHLSCRSSFNRGME